jgi:hypothetical protein
VVVLNREDAAATAVVEGMILISDNEARVLMFQVLAFFVDMLFVCALEFDSRITPYDMVMSTPLGEQLGSDACYKDCDIKLRKCDFNWRSYMIGHKEL